MAISVFAPTTTSIGENSVPLGGSSDIPDLTPNDERRSLERTIKRRFNLIRRELATIGYEYEHCKPLLDRDIKSVQSKLTELEQTVVQRWEIDPPT